MHRAYISLALLVSFGAALPACGTGLRRFPVAPPLSRDPDDAAFAPAPAEYVSPFAWDGADQMVFRPVARFFAV
ncbi:MAG: hypothetical protein JNM74_24260, partial [Myxococcales bacterium]|nr:hypothetical protein [Myxococcales bacterium]